MVDEMLTVSVSQSVTDAQHMQGSACTLHDCCCD